MKPFTRGIDLFLSANQVTSSKISQSAFCMMANFGEHNSNLAQESAEPSVQRQFQLYCQASGLLTSVYCHWLSFFSSLRWIFFCLWDRLICQIFLHRSPPNDNIEKGPWKRMQCGFDFWRSQSTDIFILLYFVPFFDIWSWQIHRFIAEPWMIFRGHRCFKKLL